jgi:hypothetical protein
MNKQELFLKAMNNKFYGELDWLVSAFSITRGMPERIAPLVIVADQTGYSYYNDALELVKVEGVDPTKPLFDSFEEIVLKPGDLPNVKVEVKTTYGNVLLNCILLIDAFGGLFDYVDYGLGPNQIEKLIYHIFEDDPEDLSQANPAKVHVFQYLKFSENCFFLTSLNKLFVVALTEKNMTPPDGLGEFKKALFEEYAGRLDDPIAIAEIEGKIQSFDADYRKGDPGNNFLNSKKSVNVVRKNKFLIGGGEPDPSDPTKMKLIKNSLDEGLRIDELPMHYDKLRSGSFGRGAETMLGGVEYKWILRATSGYKIEPKFCGTKVGLPLVVGKQDLFSLEGFSEITATGAKKIEEPGAYLGKAMMLSSPAYCKSPGLTICSTCIGDRLSMTPDGLPQAAAGYGAEFLGTFMAKMHGVAFEVVDLELDVVLT